jgi:hypothetical protein
MRVNDPKDMGVSYSIGWLTTRKRKGVISFIWILLYNGSEHIGSIS